MIGIYHRELIEAIQADPLWSKAFNEAYDHYIRTGKMAKLAEVVEEYCETKGIKHAKI